jgi:EAL domain-containing protein (putative c-di-GMP-specific phosphodiesterase class I)
MASERLVALGCGFALDDFGTGFGSFTYLKHLPLDYLKLDIEFIRELSRSRRDQRIVSAIVGVAQSLELQTIAEGVEDADTFALLRAMGIDMAQGYFIGRPQPLNGR